MFLTELFDKDYLDYQDQGQDNSTLKLGDSRKTKLTLSQINRLRRMNDLRNLEKAKELEIIQKQFAMPAGDGGGMGML